MYSPCYGDLNASKAHSKCGCASTCSNFSPAIREKIVAGRIGKRLKELALLDQPFIKDTSLSMADRVKQTSGKLGEKIVVRRFVRFVLGQGIEVAATDFAAEVAAMNPSS